LLAKAKIRQHDDIPISRQDLGYNSFFDDRWSMVDDLKVCGA
jgi:hypothetical protein